MLRPLLSEDVDMDERFAALRMTRDSSCRPVAAAREEDREGVGGGGGGGGGGCGAVPGVACLPWGTDPCGGFCAAWLEGVEVLVVLGAGVVSGLELTLFEEDEDEGLPDALSAFWDALVLWPPPPVCFGFVGVAEGLEFACAVGAGGL